VLLPVGQLYTGKELQAGLYRALPLPSKARALTNPLVLKLEQRDRLSDEEKRVLDSIITHTSTAQKGQDMVRDGDRPSESKFLLEGFAGRYKILQDGKRRITAIHVTGDFIDLHSFVLKRIDHSIVALSSCKVAHVPHASLRAITERYPHLTRLLWLHTALDGAMHRQWLAASRESALRETAHLVCELFVRLRSIGQTGGCSFPLRFCQSSRQQA